MFTYIITAVVLMMLELCYLKISGKFNITEFTSEMNIH